jgi:hypothetical protein
VLEAYLHELGCADLGDNPRELFYRLEEEGRANIDRFLEFAWVNRNRPWVPDLDVVGGKFSAAYGRSMTI